MPFSDDYCYLVIIEFNGQVRCIGYFNDEGSRGKAIEFFLKIHSAKYGYGCYRLVTRGQELSGHDLKADQLLPVDDPLNPFG